MSRPPAAMSPERWRAVKTALSAALDCDEQHRAACLDRLCGTDLALRREVESLLAVDAPSDFLRQPAAEALGVRATAGDDGAFASRLRKTLDDRYDVTRELGGGGMSRVFVATERALGRQVAIKILPNELAAGLSVERFKREIGVAARLQHANIVPLLNAGEVDGLPFYTMPFVEGLSLRVRLDRDGPLPAREAVAVLRDVARALAYAHDRGVVHRDIKPHNILIAGGAAMVTDFGIAKAISLARTTASAADGEADTTTITQLGAPLGTPAYVAPEQAVGADVDSRADVYALGCTAYELLTGRPPFHGRPAPDLIVAHLTEDPTPIAAARGDVPAALADIIMRCLAKARTDRPSAADIARELDAGEESLAHVAPLTAGRTTSRARAKFAIAVSLAVVAAVPILGRGWQSVMRAGNVPQTVAVLRLDNVGGDSTDDYFATGLAEELTNALARVDGLIVTSPGTDIAATATQRHTLARKLGVSALLGGSIQRDGNRLRVRVRLVRAADDRVLWSNTYDNTLADVLAVQSDIADSVAASLRLTLSRTAKARVAAASGTRDAEAYLLYLRARYAAARYTESDLRQSIQLYEGAIAKDSTFARAWAGMADAWAALAGDFLPPKDALPAARASARKALVLDSTLADAHVALGNVLLSDWDARGAAAEFSRAVTLETTAATTHYYAASALIALGRFNEAREHAMMAYHLEPAEPAYATAVAMAYLRLGQLDSAVAVARRAYALDSSFTQAATVLGDALRLRGSPLEALDVYASRGPEQTAYDLTGPALARIALGQSDEARRMLREITALSARQNVPADAVAMVYAGLGDRDQAFAWLERAFASHSAALVSLAVDQDWTPLRSDPRFADLVQRVAIR